MDNIVVDRSGTLKDGYFFELAVMPNEEHISIEHSETPKSDIVSLRQPTDSELFQTKKMSYVAARVDEINGADIAHDCTLNKTHATASFWKNIKIGLSGGPLYSDLIYGDLEGERTLLVPDRMAQRLKGTLLRGYRLVEVSSIDFSRIPNQSLNAKTFRLYELQFRGRACKRGFSVQGAPNSCPHCGRTPLICPECGHYELDCPDCGKEAWIAKKNQKGVADKRLIPAGWDQWRPRVIDVNRWDGSDFVFVTLDASGLRTNVVTKRVIDWLLSIHAAPFVARPVLARLDGATPEQLKMLEAAKGK